MESKETKTTEKVSQASAEIKSMSFDEIAAILQGGDSKQLREVIEEGRVTDINIISENLQSLLMIACRARYSCIECVKILLDHNANINYQTDNDSVLRCACLGRCVDILSLLIEHGIIMNDKVILDLFESEEIVRNTAIATILVGLIQDVNFEEEGQGCFLYKACRAGNNTIAELLLERGALFRFVYPDPPEIAAREGEVGERVTVVFGRHMSSDNTFQVSVKDALLLASRFGYLNTVQCMVERGVSVDTLNCALCVATEGNHVAVASYLLDHGADFNAVEPTIRHSSWISACKQGSVDMVRLLLDRGADLNAVDYRGESPLSAALPHPEVLEFLLERGADPNRFCGEGSTALLEVVLGDVATYCDISTCMQALTVLMEYGADPNLAHTGDTFLAGQTITPPLPSAQHTLKFYTKNLLA